MSKTLVAFRDKNSFVLKDQIKSICNGEARFDAEQRVWMVPQGALPELTRLSSEMNASNQNKSAEVWKKACKKCGHRFVKKGTVEYDEVLVAFKIMMKESEKNEEEEEEEDVNEDDVVFD